MTGDDEATCRRVAAVPGIPWTLIGGGAAYLFTSSARICPVTLGGGTTVGARRRDASFVTGLARRRRRFLHLGSGSPSSPSLATTTPLPGSAPMKRPRILFWSRQNSNVSDLELFGIKPPATGSISTISRPMPRPCVRLSQRCFASFSQASRIAVDEYLGLFVIDPPPARIGGPSLAPKEPQRNRNSVVGREPRSRARWPPGWAPANPEQEDAPELQSQKKSRPRNPPGRLSGLSWSRQPQASVFFAAVRDLHTTISRIPQLRQNHIHSFGERRGIEAGRKTRSNRCVP